jgi:hypothetical protein
MAVQLVSRENQKVKSIKKVKEIEKQTSNNITKKDIEKIMAGINEFILLEEKRIDESKGCKITTISTGMSVRVLVREVGLKVNITLGLVSVITILSIIGLFVR